MGLINQDSDCSIENCPCRFISGPLTIRLYGGDPITLESPCVTLLEKEGFKAEEIASTKELLFFLSGVATSTVENNDFFKKLIKLQKSLGTSFNSVKGGEKNG